MPCVWLILKTDLFYKEVLYVDRRQSVNDEVLEAIGHGCQNLMYVSPSPSLSLNLPRLTLMLLLYSHLGLGVCYNISDRGISHLVHCTQLADLTISYCDKVSYK